MSANEFRRALLGLWSAGLDAGPESREVDVEIFTAWSGATKDLLLDLGLVFDNERDEYFFAGEPGHERIELPPEKKP